VKARVGGKKKTNSSGDEVKKNEGNSPGLLGFISEQRGLK